MHARVLSCLLVALVGVATASCADVRERVDGLRAGAEELGDSARFCLSLARTATAVGSGATSTAADAAEELLVHAPEDVRDDVRDVAAQLRRAEDEGWGALDEAALTELLEALRARTDALCDPAT